MPRLFISENQFSSFKTAYGLESIRTVMPSGYIRPSIALTARQLRTFEGKLLPSARGSESARSGRVTDAISVCGDKGADSSESPGRVLASPPLSPWNASVLRVGTTGEGCVI